MLESKQSYFSFGDNNPQLANLTAIRVKYSDYKKKYNSNKTVAGSYDKNTKTIEVYFSKEQTEKLNNLGNKYKMKTFDFILKDVEGNLFAGMFSAKTLENAIRNAKRWAKLNECEFMQMVATNRNIQSYGATSIIQCTL